MPQDEKKQQKAMNSFYEKAAKKNEKKIRFLTSHLEVFFSALSRTLFNTNAFSSQNHYATMQNF